jgi:aldehyde:ferredoxin oxidoreductase
MAGAPKGNKNAKGNKGGTPVTKYKPIFAAAAKKLCELGATNADLAIAFEVALSTIWQWQSAHVEFIESCRVGKSHADERIKQSFFQRAAGYDYKAEKLFQAGGRVIRTNITQHVPADVSAGKFWLINRCRAEFLDEEDVVNDIGPRLASLMTQVSGNRFMPTEPERAISAPEPMIEGECGVVTEPTE